MAVLCLPFFQNLLPHPRGEAHQASLRSQPSPLMLALCFPGRFPRLSLHPRGDLHVHDQASPVLFSGSHAGEAPLCHSLPRRPPKWLKGGSSRARLSPRRHSAGLESPPLPGMSLQALREELATFSFSELLSTFQDLLEDLTLCICTFCDGLVLLLPVYGMFVG